MIQLVHSEKLLREQECSRDSPVENSEAVLFSTDSPLYDATSLETGLQEDTQRPLNLLASSLTEA